MDAGRINAADVGTSSSFTTTRVRNRRWAGSPGLDYLPRQAFKRRVAD